MATSSGTSAIIMAILALAKSGDNIVATSNIHGGTHHQLKGFLSRLGIQTHFVIGDNPNDFKTLIDENTQCLFLESIGNPRCNVPDLERLVEIAHDAGIPIIVSDF